MSLVSYESNNSHLSNVILYCSHKDCEPGKIATYYCNKCAQPYCLVCDDVVHSSTEMWQHRRIEVKNISTQDFEAAYRRQLISQINECADSLDSVMEDINVRMMEVQMPLDEVQDTVKNHFALLRQAIDKREKALHEEVKQLVDKKVHILRRQKTLISIVLTHADRATGFQDSNSKSAKSKLASLRQETDINGLQTLFNGVKDKLLKNIEPCETSDYPVHFDSVNMFGKLNSYGMLAGPPPPGPVSCEILETMAKIRIIWSYKNCLRKYQNTPDLDGNAISYIEPHKVLFLVECAVVKARVVEKTDDDPDPLGPPPAVGLTRRPSINPKTPVGTNEVTPRRGISRAMSGFSTFSDIFGDNPDESVVITSDLTFFEVGRISANEAWASLLFAKNNTGDNKANPNAANLRASRGSLKSSEQASKSKKDIHSGRRRSLKKDQSSHAALLQMESEYFDKLVLQSVKEEENASVHSAQDGGSPEKSPENNLLASDEGGKDMIVGSILRKSGGTKKTSNALTSKDKESVLSSKTTKSDAQTAMVTFDAAAGDQADDTMFYDFEVNEFIGCSLLFRVKAVIVNDKSEEEASSGEQSSDPKTRCQAYNSTQIIELFPNSKWTILSKPLQVPSKFVVFREFKFQYPFDSNGLLYWIGTQKLRQPYKNPHSEGYVFVEMSSYGSEASAPFKFVCHSHTMQMGPNFTKSEINAWMGLDLGPNRKLLPTHYCLRHGRADSSFVLRSWVLQGRVSATSKWVTLRRHDEDSSLPAEAYAVAFWPVMAAVKKQEPVDSFQMFRSSKMNSQSRAASTKNLGTRRRQEAMRRPSVGRPASNSISGDEQPVSGWSKLKRAVSNMGGSNLASSQSDADTDADGKVRRKSVSRLLSGGGNSANRSPGRANLGVSIDTAAAGMRNKTPPRDDVEKRRSLTARDPGPEEAAQNEFAYLQQQQQQQQDQPQALSQGQGAESSSVFPMFRSRVRGRGSGTAANSETDASSTGRSVVNEGEGDVPKALMRTVSWGERFLRRGSGNSTPGQTRRSIDGDSIAGSEDGENKDLRESGHDPNGMTSSGSPSRNSFTTEHRNSGTSSAGGDVGDNQRRPSGDLVGSSAPKGKFSASGVIKRASIFVPKLWGGNSGDDKAKGTESKGNEKTFFSSIASKLGSKPKPSPKDPNAPGSANNSNKNLSVDSEQLESSHKALSEKAVRALTGEDTPGPDQRDNSNGNSNKSPSQSKKSSSKFSAKDSISQRFRSLSFSADEPNTSGMDDNSNPSDAVDTSGMKVDNAVEEESPTKSSSVLPKTAVRRKSFNNNLATIPETLTEINSAKTPNFSLNAPSKDENHHDGASNASDLDKTPVSVMTPEEPYSPHSSPRAAAAFAASFGISLEGEDQQKDEKTDQLERSNRESKVMKEDMAKSVSGRNFSLSEPAEASGQVNVPSVAPEESDNNPDDYTDSPHSSPRAAEAFAASFGLAFEETEDYKSKSSKSSKSSSKSAKVAAGSTSGKSFALAAPSELGGRESTLSVVTNPSSPEYGTDSPHSSPRAAEAFAASFGFGEDGEADADGGGQSSDAAESSDKYNSPGVDTIPSPAGITDDASRSFKLAVPQSPSARNKLTNIPMASPLLRSTLDFDNGPDSANAGDEGEIVRNQRGSFSKLRTRSVDLTTNSAAVDNETGNIAADKRLATMKLSEADNPSSDVSSGQSSPQDTSSVKAASVEGAEIVDTNDPKALDALALSPRATIQPTMSMRRKSGVIAIDSASMEALSLSPRAGTMQRRASFKDTTDKDNDSAGSHTQKILRRKSGMGSSFDPMSMISKMGSAASGNSTPGGAARRKSFHSVSSIGSEMSEMVSPAPADNDAAQAALQQSTQRRRGSIDKLTSSGGPAATPGPASAMPLPRRSIVNSLADEDESNGYRYFRIVQHKGILQSSHLSCAGIELYGKLTEELT